MRVLSLSCRTVDTGQGNEKHRHCNCSKERCSVGAWKTGEGAGCACQNAFAAAGGSLRVLPAGVGGVDGDARASGARGLHVPADRAARHEHHRRRRSHGWLHVGTLRYRTSFSATMSKEAPYSYLLVHP